MTLHNHTSILLLDTSNSSAYTWSFTPISEMVISPVAVVLNAYCLFVFLIKRELRTPFNVYLRNLLFANLIYTVLNNPLGIVDALFHTWPLGATACNVYTYSLSALGALTVNSHVIITLNRFWAVTFPVNYRTHHNTRTSLMAVALLWIYVHAICLPGIILDALYYRLNLLENRCLLNGAAQFTWNTFVQFVLYAGPVCFILLTYPFILFKHTRRKRIRFSLSRRASSKAIPTSTPPQENEQTVNLPKPVSERSYALTVTSLLTLSILVCWAPNVIVYTVNGFMGIDSPVVFRVISLLFALQSVMDPILFALAMKDLRRALCQPLQIHPGQCR
ncbi:5-hydroxytryptamine receptor 1D-like [Paramacrobiotus metropolitanus]|uniref:5-hydroxytryptamine receptor 1D-like n=1 Tax=Paramacrobiotus metropolitanus TaxID=2943436 RepID=UPI0024461F78|nr:5-hydroxytryptamine receptor 1D-like [Paramacrobiotus metropolitanus]